MREGWNQTTLGSICEFENGDRGKNYPGRKAFVPTGIPFVNAGHLDDGAINWQSMDFIPRERFDLLGNGKIQMGDLLFCLRGSLGKFAVVDRDVEGAIASSLVIVRPNENLKGDFLAAYFRSGICAEMITKFANGAAQPNLSAKSLKSFEIPLPSLPEQKRIVAILDEAFEGIDAAVANAEKNLANARELFESYLNDVFAKKGEDWEEATIGEVCTLRSGTTVPKSLERNTGGVPYLKVADMSFPGNETSVNSSSRFLDLSAISPRSIFPIGTVIFPKRGGAIATNKKRITAVEIAADLNIMGVIPSERICPEFLYFYFLQFDLASIGSGSSIPQINNYDIDPLRIRFPMSLNKQREITAQLQSLRDATTSLEGNYRSKVEMLAELKQSFLQKAFAGELTAQPDKALGAAVA